MEPKSILVINVSRIGDTLLVSPALKALAKKWPQAKITFLGHPKRVEIMENLPFLYEVGGITKRSSIFKGWIPGKKFDLAIVYNYDEPLVSYAIRVAKKVVAFKQKTQKLNDRLYKYIEHPAFQAMHSALLPLLLTQTLSIPDADYALAYKVTPAENEWAKQKLKKPCSPLIALQVASFPTKAYRDWPIEYFIELCNRILAKWSSAHFMIMGGELEKDRTEMFAQHLKQHASLFAGKLTLRQSAALMNQAHLYIGVDTGPTHIMGALHRPMIALYHCYSPSRLLQPLDHPCCYVIDHPRVAEGCGPETPMSEISVDTVWNKVVHAFTEHPPSQQ